jgi:sec-independent protein translocase protein TatA
MFDVGGGELLLILLVVLMLFGPKKIPEFMQMLGKGIRQFKKAQEDLTEQIRDLSTVEPQSSPAKPSVVVTPASAVPRTAETQDDDDDSATPSTQADIAPSNEDDDGSTPRS